MQTAEGLPIAHEVHPDNTAEANILLLMIRGLLARYTLKRVVQIADGKLFSTSNIDELNKLQAPWVEFFSQRPTIFFGAMLFLG